MGLKDLFDKIWSDSKQKDKKETKKRSKKVKKIKVVSEYSNRFVKFYHLNKDRLNKERKGSYSQKKKSGICVRCNRKALNGIIFCEYHQQMQKGYNEKAREK